MENGVIFYLSAVNIVTFAAFAIDKRRAVRGAWRISERTLLGLALIGGTVGGLAAMRLFRHKTRKAGFFLGIPVMLAVQAALLVFLKSRGIL